MESTSAAKRLCHIVRAVFYMLGKRLSMDKLMMDLHLLLKHGKTARRALSNLMTFHHHHHHTMYSSISCLSMDPELSFYSPMPKEVQFSCSSTPSYPSFHAIKRRNRHRRYDYDATVVAKAFEMLNSEISDVESIMASPSPAPVIWSFRKSPAAVRQLRVTDSPFPLREEDEEADGRIDREAEEFINRFYEHLRLQQMIPVTPEYRHRSRREQLMRQA